MDGHIIALILRMESQGLEVSVLKVPPSAFTCRIPWFESSIHSKTIRTPKSRKIFDPDVGHQDMRMLHGKAAPNASYHTPVQIPSRLLNLADPVLIRLASAQHGGGCLSDGGLGRISGGNSLWKTKSFIHRDWQIEGQNPAS